MSVSPIGCIKPAVAALLAIGILTFGISATLGQSKSQERLGGTPETADPGKDTSRLDDEPDALPDIMYDIGKLPAPVRDTLSRILRAARSGDLELVRTVIESNELVPAFTYSDEKDPISYWKRVSRDGEGREILAEMLKVFSSGFVRMDPGTPDELFIWPYHFVYPLDDLMPSQLVELYVLVNPEDARTMIESGGYFGFRGGISPDGTWQYFIAGD